MDFNLANLLSDEDFDMPCENCNNDFAVQFKEIQEEGSVLICPHCKVEITITHDEGFQSEMESAQEALNELEDTLDNLFN